MSAAILGGGRELIPAEDSLANLRVLDLLLREEKTERKY
jgi:hypothetical protein